MVRRLAAVCLVLIVAITVVYSVGMSRGRYVDDFGVYTGGYYIGNNRIAQGTFTNSATTDSPIRWDILVDQDNVSFFIYEYGTTQVLGSYAYPTEYIVRARTDEGKYIVLDGENSRDRIVVDDSGYKLRRAMADSSSIKFVIDEVTPYTPVTYYLDELDTSEFSRLYEETFDGLPWVKLKINIDSSNVVDSIRESTGALWGLLENSITFRVDIRDSENKIIGSSNRTVLPSASVASCYVGSMRDGKKLCVTVTYMAEGRVIGEMSEDIIVDASNLEVTIIPDASYAYPDALETLRSVAAEIQTLKERMDYWASIRRAEAAVAEEKQRAWVAFGDYNGSAGINIGYVANTSIDGASYLRIGFSGIWLPDMGNQGSDVGLAIRLDTALFSYGNHMVYPGYDITISATTRHFLKMTEKFGFEFGFGGGLGYMHSMIAGKQFTDSFLMRLICNAGMQFASGFAFGFDLFFDLAFYEGEFGLDADFIFVPMLYGKFSF